MSNPLNTLTIATGAASLLLIYLMVKYWRGLLFILNPGIPRVEIVPPDQAPPVPSLELEQQLLSLGFRLVSVSLAKYNLIQAYSWNYLDPTDTISVEMIAARRKTTSALVAFNTWFHDQAFIYNSYPLGDHVETADLLTNYASRSLDTALDYHRQQILTWRKLHGDPVIRTSLADMDHYDQVYRDKYYKQHLAGRIKRALLFQLTLILMLIANIAVMLESIHLQPIFAGVINGTIDPQLSWNSGLIRANAPYLLHWVIGCIVIWRLAVWKSPSIENLQPSP